MNKPIVSIIIPCYNYAHLLGETLKNVQQQTFSEWECIVIDDGSTDNTAEVIKQISDPRISYVRQNNSGPSVARNNGIKKAQGDFIQFLDADDLLETQKLETQVNILRSDKEVGIVYSGVMYFKDSAPEKLYTSFSLDNTPSWMKDISGSGDAIVLQLLKANIMVISSPLIRKNIFEKCGSFDESLKYNEDWDLWLRYAMAGIKFRFDNSENTKALIRVHDSYSKDNFKMFLFGLQVCLKAKQKLDGYRYSKILTPKINYHLKVIDRKLIVQLSKDKQKAVEMCRMIYDITQLDRYRVYAANFDRMSFAMNKFIVSTKAVLNKLKSMLIYGS